MARPYGKTTILVTVSPIRIDGELVGLSQLVLLKDEVQELCARFDDSGRESFEREMLPDGYPDRARRSNQECQQMSRMSAPAEADIPAASRPAIDAAAHQLGFVPNMYHALAASPKAFNAWLDLRKAMTPHWTLRPARVSPTLSTKSTAATTAMLCTHGYLSR